MKKIVLLLPTYNATRTLTAFLRSLSRDIFDEIILVDDCSTDGTLELAKQQKNFLVYQTPQNLGYGGNLKYCLSLALEHGGDVFVELHPDGEYLNDGIRPALDAVDRGAVFVLGNRFAGRLAGMNWWKYIVTRLLTAVDNVVLGTHIPDLHQGFRVYTRKLLDTINFRATSNDYAFSFEIIAQTRFAGLPIATVPVSTRYTGKKRGAPWVKSILYVLATFRVLGQFVFARAGLVAGLFCKPGNTAACPNCRLPYLVEQRARSNRFTLYFCTLCHNGFTRPIPKDLGSYYGVNYWNYVGILGFIRNALFDLFQTRRKRWIQEYLPKGGRVLDIGSGEGAFGKSLGERYSTVNIEAPFANVKNTDVIRVDFLRWRRAAVFDAVVFWQSLEHTPEPQKYLAKAKELLKEGGLVFIEYPRYNSLEARLFGLHWFHLDLPRHLSHFTDRGLSVILARLGLAKVAQRPILALEYAPGGLFLSLMNFFAVRRETILPPSGSAIVLILLSPVIVVGVVAECILFAMGQSPIGLMVAKKV